MPRDYRKIIAWQKAHELTLLVYKLTAPFPKHEIYGVTSQVRRAAVSAATNIVEGSGRDTKRDFLHFLYIALGSLKETEYLLLLAHDLGYLPDEAYVELTTNLNKVFPTLQGLINAVKQEAGRLGSLMAWITSGATLCLARSLGTFASHVS